MNPIAFEIFSPGWFDENTKLLIAFFSVIGLIAYIYLLSRFVNYFLNETDDDPTT